MARALRRADRGQSLSPDEATALLGARGSASEDVLAVAARVRDRRFASQQRSVAEPVERLRITYSPKVFVPLTRLCRDRCHYCTFVASPSRLQRDGQGMYMELDEVEQIARAGVQAGCREVLITLGDRPEDRWPQARSFLQERGYTSTVEYVRAACIRVIESTGLLPHVNAGVLTWEELRQLRPVSPSMGLMLESSSQRLFNTPGAVHFGSPDKDPALRLRCIEDAGRLAIPFTSGVLAGIGETPEEYVDSVLALRSISREFGHIQEVIIQNFRAKPDTPMRGRPDAEGRPFALAVAVARILLGPAIAVQSPPNLNRGEQLDQLLSAGIDDLGGISPVTLDHVNPERPWPQLDELESACQKVGADLVPRLTVYPRYVRAGAEWVDPRLLPAVEALSNSDGLVARDAEPTPCAWQEQSDSYDTFSQREDQGRTDLSSAIDNEGRRQQTRSDMASVYGDWESIDLRADRSRTKSAGPALLDSELSQAMTIALTRPAALREPGRHQAAVELMSSDGAVLDELCAIADERRRTVVGDDVTYVINRNINFTNVCYTGCRFCAFAQRESDPDAYTLSPGDISARVEEAVAVGATEICMQGGIHPRLPASAYFDLIAVVKETAPDVHLHAFSPMEIVNGAHRADMSIEQWLGRARDAGLGSIPGTAAEILDDDIRWVLTKGKLPTSQWIEVVTTAHRLGIPSSSTMMYGHVDNPEHWVGHLRALAEIQQQTGGFTEFVGLPFIHHNSPIYLAGVARPGSTRREDRAVTAMSRLMLDGLIDNIQVSWVKLGPSGCVDLLRSGANDLGGTLMEETISRMAGSEFGSQMTPDQLQDIAAAVGRPSRQRTTLYEMARS